jgi:hypothetical protein
VVPAQVTQQGGGITGGYQGAGSGGLGIAAQLAAQECDEKAKTLGGAARDFKLEAAQTTSQSGPKRRPGRKGGCGASEPTPEGPQP